jgi:hypothetical protein
MLEAIVKHGVTFYAMGIVLAVGVFAKVISHITIGKMAKAASEIQNSNHKLMKLVKAKFEHATMVSDKVQNVEVFVKKYLYEYRVLGRRLEDWRTMQRRAVFLVSGIGILGTILSMNIMGAVEVTFQHFAWTGIFTIVMLVVHIWSNEAAKLDAVQNYMVDYLENVCVRRYEKANNSIFTEEETEAEREILERPEKDLSKEREEQERRIRAILEEFLA